MFFRINPQSVAQLGSKTEFDKTHQPWRVLILHVVFDVWSNDDLLKTSPCYFVSQQLYLDILDKKFSGINLDSEIVTDLSETFIRLYPEKSIPKFYLLRIFGEAFKDDFGLDNTNKLIVSHRAFSVLKNYNLSDAKIEEV